MLGEHKTLELKYSGNFLNKYLGKIKNDASIAIIEMIANCWDAASEEVRITWPDVGDPEGCIEIKDDGNGMTFEDFNSVWTEASYDRTKQGLKVTLSDGTTRNVFGRQGIGRFGMFCFSDKYYVETWRGEETNTFEISIGKPSSEKPFNIDHIDNGSKGGKGTRVYCKKEGMRSFLSADGLKNKICEKFYDNRKFRVWINEIEVEFPTKNPMCTEEYDIDGNKITISRYELDKIRKTKGIVFRINRRVVGEPSWDLIEDEIDIRRNEFKLLLTVDVDHLKDHVNDDWTGFNESDYIKSLMSKIRDKILDSLTDVFHASKRDMKKDAFKHNLTEIRKLNAQSKDKLGEVVDSLLSAYPTIGDKGLNNVVKVSQIVKIVQVDTH